MLNKHLLLTLIAGTLALTSCTVSEPDEAEGAADNLRLKSINSYGIPLMTVDYDNYGRIVEINFARENVYTFTYPSATATIPSEVTQIMYNFTYKYDGDKETEVRYMDEKYVWTDIQATNNLITSLTETSSSYSESGNVVDTDTEKRTFEYDSNGHLVRYYYDNELEQVFTWEGNLLISSHDVDTGNPEYVEYTYSDTANITGQWDPNNQVIGPIAITGFFGKAPAKFFKSQTYVSGGVLESIIQYSYSLMPNGLIKAAKIANSDDDEITVLNFQYEKK